MIRLGEAMMILELHRQGLSVTAIARRTGRDPKTVRKYIERGVEVPVYGPRVAGRPSKIAPYMEFLRERVAAFPELTASRLTREIREMGYMGAYTAVKRYLAAIRPEHDPKPYEVRFETRAGVPVDPDIGTVPKRWIKFLKQICQGDMELVRFLQRWAGYSLSGSVAEHALLMIYGPGGNGKGVLINTLATIMGSYHREATPDTFVEGKSRTHETAMAFIAGARMVTSSETDQGGSWNEATMKRAVAGDSVTARFLYKNPFTYRPTYKIWIATNHLPKLKSVGPAMRRRIHLLELDYVPKRPDPDLEARLRDEHEAILAWMLEGAREWRKQGLNPPTSVRRATDEYFEEQDVMGVWLREKTRRSEAAVTPSSALCDSYNRFLRSRNMPEVDASYFGRQLSARGYQRQLTKAHKGGVRTRCFIGLRLKVNS